MSGDLWGGRRFCIYKLEVGQRSSGHKRAVKYFQPESRPSPTLAALSVKRQDLERLSGISTPLVVRASEPQLRRVRGGRGVRGGSSPPSPPDPSPAVVEKER